MQRAAFVRYSLRFREELFAARGGISRPRRYTHRLNEREFSKV